MKAAPDPEASIGAPGTPDRSHLENSRQFPWDRVSTAPNWPAALDRWLAALEAQESRQRARRGADSVRLRETLGAMLLGLYGAYRADAGRWLAYSRNNTDYATRNRYTMPDLSARSVTSAADFLIQAGLVDHRRGSYNRERYGFGGIGYRSRIKARPALIELLEDRDGLRIDTLGFAGWSEVIRLKGSRVTRKGPKPLLLYQDNDTTIRMREQLRKLNDFLGEFRIDLEGAADPEPRLESDEDDDQDELVLTSRGPPRLYRVFNNGRWDHGGRFYGGWWQVMRKADRVGLLIDGEETVELDFRSLHPRLCYHLQGQPLPDDVDPYEVAGLIGPNQRDLIKKAFNQLLNSTPSMNPRAPQGARSVLPRGLSYARLLSRIEQQHAAIASWFRSGRGMELQRIDSDIAASILANLRHRGICCLPIHDSFIVPRSSEFALGQAMLLAYHAILGREVEVRAYPVISGWSSIELEQAVLSSLPPP